MKQNLYHFRAVLPGLLSLLFACAFSTLAADRTWSGASGVSANWNDSANWDTLPDNGDNLVFSGTTQQMNTNDLAALQPGWLRFANGGFTIDGNGLALSGGLTNTAGNNTLNPNLTLTAPQIFASETTTEVLTLGGAISNGANNLTIEGAGDMAWTMSATQGLKGGSNLIKNSTGTLTIGGGFIFPAAGPNFAGNTIVNGGTLSLGVGCFDGNSPMGQSLTINPGATVTVDQPHIAGSGGRPVNVYGGTLTMNRESYLTALTLSNATVNGTYEIRGTGGITNIASTASTTWSANLSLANGVHSFYVADGAADPDLDFQGVILGSGPLTKNGPGKLTLNGACTYTGPTLVNEGTLAIGASGFIASVTNISVATNATLDLTANTLTLAAGQKLLGNGTVLGDVFDGSGGIIAPGASAGTLTFSNSLTLQGAGGNLNFDLANTLTVGAGVNDLLVVSNLVISGPTTVSFSFLNGLPNVGGAYTLIQYGAFTGNVNDFVAAPSRYSFTFTNDTAAKAIKLIISGIPAALTWQGDGGANFWDVNTSLNWTNATGAADLFLHGDNVTFNDTSANTTVDVQTSMIPQSVTVNSAQDYALTTTAAGSLDGGGSLIKQGTGMLTLAVDNNLGGNGSVSAGTVQVGNGGVVGGLGTAFTTNNSQIVFNRANTYAYTGTVNGSGGVTISNGTVQLGAGGTSGTILNPITNYATLAVNRTDSPTIPGPVLGTGGVNLVGGASARFNNITTPTGQLTVGNSGGVAASLTVGSGDSITVNRLYVGEGGNNLGVINQSAGVINVTDSTDTEGPVRLGHWAGGTSTYNMTGGQLIVTNGANARLSIGIDGIGIWNVTGGTATVNRVDVNGRNATGGGTLNLTNGSIILGAGGLQGNAPYTVNFAGGTLGAGASWSSSLTGTLASASSAVTFDSGANTITYSGRLQGPGGLVKQGSGTLALTGVDAYTGTSTVSNGTLGATVLVGPVIVQSNGTLSAGALFTPAVLAITNDLTLNGGAGLNVDLGNTNSLGGVNDLILVQNNLTLSGSIPVAFNFLGSPYTAGPYTLITNIGSQVGSATFFITNNQTRLTPAFSTTANSVRVQFSGSGASLVWKGDSTANLWDLGTTNWLRTGIPDRFFTADTVTFDDTGSTTPNVNVTGITIPVSATVNSSNNYVWTGSGKLSGGAALTKSGIGKLTLATDNDFAGAVNVTAGTLEIGNGGGSGSFTTTAVTNNGTMTYNRTNAQSIAYNTRGSGGIVKENTNTLTATASQALTGGIIINRGTMRSTVGNFGGAFTPTITINTNGTFLTDVAHASGGGSSMFINRGTWLQNFEDYKQNVTMVDGLIATGGAGNGGEYRVGLSGGAGNFNLNISNSTVGSVINQRVNTILANNNLHVNVTRGAAPTDLTINRQVYNPGNLNINGNGIVTLNSGSNSYNGITRITGGTLVLGNNETLTNTAAITILSPGLLDVSGVSYMLGQFKAQTLAGNGAIVGDFADNAASTVLPGNLFLSGTTNVTAVGTLTLGNNATLNGATYAFKLFNPAFVGGGVNDLVDIKGTLTPGGLTILTLSTNANPIPGTYQVIKYTGAPVTPGSFVAGTPSLTTRYALAVDDTQPNHIDLIVTGSASNLLWSGDGTGNAWDVNTTANWNANSQTFYNWDNVTFDDTSSNNNVTNAVAVIPAGVTFNNSTKNYNLSGAGKIGGSASLTKNAVGSLTLNNRHDYLGATTINGGVLALNIGGSAGTLQGGGPVTVNSGGTLLSLVNDSFGFGLGTKINTLNINGGAVIHAPTNNVSMWGIAITMIGGSMAATNTGNASLDLGSAGGFMPLSTLTTLASASSATISGQRFNLRQSLCTNTVADGAATKDLVIATRFSGNGNTWVKQGPGTLSLEGATDNDSLNLRVDAGTVLLEKTSSGSVHAVGSVLTINGGTVKETGGGGDQILNSCAVTLNGGVLDLNGNSDAVNTLAGTNGVVRNDFAATTSTLTIGQNNGSSTFGSLIQDGAGAVALTKSGTGTAMITNINAYTGNTAVSGGTLALVAPMSVSVSPILTVGSGSTLNVAGLANSTITNGAGQLLVGSGMVAGSLRVNGTLYVGNTNNVGTLTVTTNLVLAGTTLMELNKTGGVLTNDQCVVSGTVTYGGTLTVTGLGGAYAPGDTFQLFNAGARAGSFSTINLPAHVTWNTSNLGVNGTISVVSVTPPAVTSSTSLGAGGFQLSFNGPAGNTYRVLAQTNVTAAPISTQWTPIATNLFGPSGTATFTDLNATNFPLRFYLISVP